MLHIDKIFISRLSTQLERFSQKNDTLFNCRCPLCGDSQKKKYKARGFFYQKGSQFNYMCHNCGASMTLHSFLEQVSPNLLKEYKVEKWKAGQTGRKSPVREKTDAYNFDFKPKFKSKCEFNLGTKITDLPDDHPAKKYISERKLPQELLFYTDDFRSVAMSLTKTQKYSNLMKNDKRIVIPFFDTKCNVIYLQGRSIGQSEVKYITIKLDDTPPKIFGLERLDTSKKVCVTEGPFDSLFLDNSVAMAGADADTTHFKTMENVVFIFDNEPRNKQIVDRMEKIISEKFNIFFWPKNISAKDINDAILDGIDETEIMNIISKNTASGLKAKMILSDWRKC